MTTAITTATKPAKRKPAKRRPTPPPAIGLTDASLKKLGEAKLKLMEARAKELLENNPALLRRFLALAKFTPSADLITKEALAGLTKAELIAWANAFAIDVPTKGTHAEISEALLASPKFGLCAEFANLPPKV